MRYLVTGGVGFLGTNLSLALLRDGHEVVVLDNLSTAYNQNLDELSKYPSFSFVKCDIKDPIDITPKDFDFIYNMACPASPSKYQKKPVDTFRTSVWGIWNILQLAKEARIPVLHTSTSEIYGDPLKHPQNEAYWGNVNPIGVRACYDE